MPYDREPGEIDTGAQPAFKSLRSRFEHLATSSQPSSPPGTTRRHASGPKDQPKGNRDQDAEFLLSDEPPASPRGRSSSNGAGGRSASGTFLDAGSSHHLRTSSSSSDLSSAELKAKVKRPPPPPPPGRSKGNGLPPAPASIHSPLLRPAPRPPIPGSPRVGAVSLPVSDLSTGSGDEYFEGLDPLTRSKFSTQSNQYLVAPGTQPNPYLITPGSSPRLAPINNGSPSSTISLDSADTLASSLTSLRNKFSATTVTPPRPVPPRPAGTLNLLTHSESDPAVVPPTKPPAIPPRQAKTVDTINLHSPVQPIPHPAAGNSILGQFVAHSPDEIFLNPSKSSSSLRAGNRRSPFSDEETGLIGSVSSSPVSWSKRSGSRNRQYISPQVTGSDLTSGSQTSLASNSESDFGVLAKAPPPPRPPPRMRPAVQDTSIFSSPAHSQLTATSLSSATSSSTSLSAPPPLPVRRSPGSLPIMDDPLSGPPPSAPAGGVGRPPLPNRPLHIQLQPDSPVIGSPTTATERRPLGSAKLPPPPTRTIALGDKLPPARRPGGSESDEESGDEEDTRVPAVDMLPDSSRSSRRPPALQFREGYTSPRVPVHAFAGTSSVAGTTAVVGHHHHVKVYDLGAGGVDPSPRIVVDTRELGVKVTCMEFRPCASRPDRGHVLWLGSKEGHIFEMDARTGAFIDRRHAAHLYPVTHVFRYGRSMITVDESGKCLIYSPAEDGQDVSLTYTQPRVVRIAEKQDFMKMVGGKMWTAARGDQQFIGGQQKVPVVRVYDMFSGANVAKTVVPVEHVGPVTDATIIPSQPDVVYMGHEEGYVSVWELACAEEGGNPKCIEVLKVSTSDVLCLEGVNDRLWVGGRNGMIAAYDVTQKPWMTTNNWAAHPGLPVLKMAVDHYGIDKCGHLCVVSTGRDEQLRFWDGLLGLDWADAELTKQEHAFSKTHDLTLLIISWNCDAAKPDALTGDPANLSFLSDALSSVDSPDIIVFGFQEVIDLESRKMAAKNVILGSKKKEDGGLSDKVTGAYKRWYDRLQLAMRQYMPAETPYIPVHTESLVGLLSCVFVKQAQRHMLKDASIMVIKRGMGGRYGNKGGIVSRFVVLDSSICLVNCHLAAGQNAVRQRNADVASMLEHKDVFPVGEQHGAYVGGGDGTMALDHEIVFVSGDMNYRIDHRREAIIQAIRNQDLHSLYAHDQLLREIKFNRACRFRGFHEGTLVFTPTYKYDRRSNEFDTSEKHRSPAWCDRILWRSMVPGRVEQLHYRRYEVNVSDHRPISGAFKVTVKSIEHEMRRGITEDVKARWVGEQARLLTVSKHFYVRQSLI